MKYGRRLLRWFVFLGAVVRERRADPTAPVADLSDEANGIKVVAIMPFI